MMHDAKEFRSLAIVPARCGSKRLSDKNIRLLLGRPLVEYAIRAMVASASISRCVVSSDDERVLAIAEEIDPTLPLVRPAELAKDDSLTIDTVKHALATLEENGEGPFDSTVVVQPTAPLVLAEDIDRCVERVNAGADSAVTVTRMAGLHPSKIKRVRSGFLEPYFPDASEVEGTRGQDLAPAFIRSGAVYVTRRDILLNGSLYGSSVAAVEVPRERSVDIDEPFDWMFAEFLLSRQRRKLS